MNEQERLNILKQLSSGEISAEKAARLLSGAEEPTIVVEVEIEAQPSVEPATIIIEKVVSESEVATPEVLAVPSPPSETHVHNVQIEIVQDKGADAAQHIRFSAVDQNGDLDIDLMIPVALLKLGQQIGDRFAPTLNGWNWNTLDLDINLDTLHVRVSAE